LFNFTFSNIYDIEIHFQINAVDLNYIYILCYQPISLHGKKKGKGKVHSGTSHKGPGGSIGIALLLL